MQKMINLTNNAVEKLKSFITQGEVVRLSVQGGGCAGFEYKFGLMPVEDCFEDDYIISSPSMYEYYNLETPPEQWTNKCISNRILI